MKKIILSFLVLIGLAVALPADELWLGEVPFVNMSSGSEDTFVIKYETDKDEYYIATSDWLGESKVILSYEQLESLRGTISKVLEWTKLAIDKNLEVDKEIPNSTIEANVKWNWGANQYKNASWDKLNLRFRFSSVAGEKNMVTLLLIAGSTITSSYDEEVTYSFPLSLLSEDSVNTFMNVISQNNIDSKVNKHEESKKAEDLFN